MNKQQQAEAVFAELDICQDGWITKGELELVDVVVVDVIADVIVVVCTLMGVREYMGLVLVASRATTPPLPYYQLSPHFALDLSKYDPLQKMPYQCFLLKFWVLMT